MRLMAMAAGVAVLAGAALCLEAQPAPPAKAAPMMVTTGSPTVQKEKPLLPDAFAGWVAAEKPKTVTDPAELDSANATALKEYGFAGGLTANYKTQRLKR